ncbi:MAG: 4'-phosphopantetheinyl transferase superfamily protein [Elusimicrobia bacterium]|nr:4'-phosphopantetheinyl transferase superfamily protein [Elusimicrobiota bacterium]
MKPYLKIKEVTEPGGLENFSEREKDIFYSLKNPKRRGEWYWARISAKELLSDIYKINQKEIEILNDQNRVPYAKINQKKINISISHRAGLCGCAVSQSSSPVGMDIEKKEEKNISFFEEYLNEEEISMCAKNPNIFSDIWALKEASLKMLGLGLSISAKDVCVNREEILFKGQALEKAKQLNIVKTNFELQTKNDWRIALVWS